MDVRAPLAGVRKNGFVRFSPKPRRPGAAPSPPQPGGAVRRGGGRGAAAAVAGGDRSRVEAVGGDARPLEPTRQLGGEVDVGELGTRVDLHAPVVLLGLEVVEAEAVAPRRE